MIDLQNRFGDGSGWGGGPQKLFCWIFQDYDTRRCIVIEGPEDVYEDEEEGPLKAHEAIKSAVDELDRDLNIHKLSFCANGKLIGSSTDPNDDETCIAHYPVFIPQDFHVKESEVVKRVQLVEKDRITRNIDLVESDTSSEHVVFKYEYVGRSEQLERLWNDAFILRALHGQPHIVPFRQFVIDDHTSGFLGFTMKYISGGSLHGLLYSGQTFTLKRRWLLDMMATIDNLNLNHGIIHQDVALRNILIDSDHVDSDHIYLTDFGLTARIGSQESPPNPHLDDIKMLMFAFYHLITGDEKYACKHPSYYNLEDITKLDEWPCAAKVKLETGVTVQKLRADLSKWAKSRLANHTGYSQNNKHKLQWPMMPETSIYDKNCCTRSQTTSSIHRRKFYRRQLSPSEYFVNWERPSGKALERQKEPTAHLRHQHQNHKDCKHHNVSH